MENFSLTNQRNHITRKINIIDSSSIPYYYIRSVIIVEESQEHQIETIIYYVYMENIQTQNV